jgi:hypothetical protein
MHDHFDPYWQHAEAKSEDKAEWIRRIKSSKVVRIKGRTLGKNRRPRPVTLSVVKSLK